jgi:uncharacterized RDD family membrane protein YckC
MKRSRFVIVEYEDRVTIETPEGLDLQLTLAGVGSRFTSALVDNLIQLLLVAALGLILGLGIGLAPDEGGFAVAVWTLGSFLVFVGYDVSFEVLASGRTPGKRLNGLRVVREGGEPVTFLASATRNVLRLIDMLPSLYLVGCISVLVTKRNQRLGDLAAGTLVVRERRAVSTRPALRRWGRAPRALPEASASSDTTAITDEELAAVSSFLERRNELTWDARNQVALTLADRLRPKVAGPLVGYAAEQFLEALVLAKASRE